VPFRLEAVSSVPYKLSNNLRLDGVQATRASVNTNPIRKSELSWLQVLIMGQN